MVTTRIVNNLNLNLIYETLCCGLGQEVACLFQCWKNSAGFLIIFDDAGVKFIF